MASSPITRISRRTRLRFTPCPRPMSRCTIFGSRKIVQRLIGRGHGVNRKRVRRLMRVMGLEAIYPKPKLSAAGRGHKVYPYLLRDVAVERVNQVWSADITYV